MTCKSIRTHIEEADAALRKATVIALENKHDEQLETLFQALSKVKELILTTPIRAVDNVASYYRDKAEYDFKLDSPFLDDTVVTFPTNFTGGEGEDHIEINTDGVFTTDTVDFSDYGYQLNDDVITFSDEQETTKHGKDMDNL